MTETLSSAEETSRAAMPYRTKLIEVALPLEAINAASAREKSIRHGHPSTLHLWWARRPLAACRAVLFAQLVDDPSAVPEEFPTEEAQEAERQRLFRIIEQLVKWENSTNEMVLMAARREIARSVARTAGVPAPDTDGDVWQVLREHAPPVLDPFCGGGSIPLEAQRLGLEAHASDLNPVAVLITKAMIEIPPKFANQPPVNPEDRNRGMGAAWKGAAGLAADVRYYGQWMRDEAYRRIGHLYPKVRLPEGSEATVIAWLWARTVTCPNPACGARMPLVRSFALSTKKGKETYIEPVVEREAKTVRFEVRHGKNVPEGTVNRRGAGCIVCGTHVPFAHVRAEGRAGRMSQRLMAVVAEGHRGREYVPPTAYQVEVAESTRPRWTPDADLPRNPRDFKTPNYGMRTFADLFTPRQLVALTTFSDLVGEARARVLADCPHPPAPSPSGGEGEMGIGEMGIGEMGVGEMGAGDVGIGGAGEDGGRGDGLGRIAVPAGLETRMVEVARGFRRNPTPSEGHLWALVRGNQLGARFRRQQPIGPFVVDFYCAHHHLIVEVDGPIHEAQRERDQERQALLEACGYRVLRLSAWQVEHDPDAVLRSISSALEETPGGQTSAPFDAEQSDASHQATTTPSPLSPGGRGAGGEGPEAYADAVATYLAIGVSRMTDIGNSLCRWEASKTQVRNLFGLQAIPMVWDFAEPNVFADAAGDYRVSLSNLLKSLENVPALSFSTSRQDNSSDLAPSARRAIVSTDPPYYDNIGYADLSDFFYVWLRRSLRSIYPDLFRTILVPKAEELVATPYRFGGDKRAAEAFFRRGLEHTFVRLSTVQDASYPLTVYYAFKQAEGANEGGRASTGWETMLAGLIEAGFSVSGTWPMRSELSNRMVASGTNALASSIVLVCTRRDPHAPIATRREFITALRAELPTALRHLTHGNIAAVDLAQAAIGPGMRVFSRYSRVIESSGEPMSVRSALGLINQILYEVQAESETEYDPETRWAITWFEQYGMNDGPFGDAETLFKAKDTSESALKEADIIHARAGKVRLVWRDEIPTHWDPRLAHRVTIWHATQQLIRALDREGEMTAARLLRHLGGVGDAARDLAYALYLMAERKKRTEEALAYNSLVVAWPEMHRLAAESESGQIGLEV